MRVTDLRCEHWTEPINLDTAVPRFSWVLQDPTRGQRQTAYRVRVATSVERLAADQNDIAADLWDTGRVASADTLQIAYAGRTLGSRQNAVWTVQAWDKDGIATPPSEPAVFATALLHDADWTASWITAPAASDHASDDAPPLFRRSFRIEKPLARVVIYLCGLGQFELSCNGRRVGDELLRPGWTNYRKTCQYVAHDLTAMLKEGDNALGVMIGHGMYHVGPAPAGTKRYTKFKASFGPPVLVAQMHLDYADGTAETIGTDDRWQTAAGPITYSNIYGGEDHDARRERPGWDTAAFTADDGWRPAVRHAGPGGRLRGSSVAAPPVRVTQTFDATIMPGPSPGGVVYDAGQNASMIPRLVCRGPAGSTVRLWPGESLKDGSVNQKHTGSPVYFTYTLRGGGEETWQPRFSYTGARYVQVETAAPADAPDAGLPTIVAVQSLHVTAAGPRAGHFECSNDLFTRTAGLIDRAIRSNTVSVLTDCPHREKLGWTEQQHLMGPSLMYAYDLAALFAKVCGDHTDAQHDTGHVPTICPQYTTFDAKYDVFNDSPEWGSAGVLVPWQAYRWYGDESLLVRQYPTMKRYVDYLTRRATDHIVSHGLGDWYDLGPNPPGFTQLTPVALTATAIYFHDAEVLSAAASRLGFANDAAHYRDLAAAIRTAFNATFYDPATRQYATASQTSLAMPLFLGLVPDADRDAVLANLIADIRAHDDGLTSGDVGYRYLLRALAAAGRGDVIFAMNRRADRPGYGMMLAKGETSLTEAWDARPQSSLNHFMLGHIQEWFYADLAGIGQGDDSVAFSRIVIAPTPVGDVSHAKAAYDSVRGRIAVDWSIDAGTPIDACRFTLNCTIPPNTTAVVRVPTNDPASVREGGRPAAESPGVRVVASDRVATFVVESGTYTFTASVPSPGNPGEG